MFSKERMADLFIRWANSTPSTIYEAYKYPSGNKIREYEIIRQDKYNHGVTVMAATCQFFSVGYVREEDGKLWFVYNTGRYRYTLDLSENQAWCALAERHLQVLGNEQ